MARITGARVTWLRAVAPYLVTVALFAAGLFALNRLLAEVDLHQVAQEMRATSPGALIAALVATLLSYLALVGYDLSALHHIRKTLPFPVTALGSLMSFALGNTIGLAALSGAAVRYRVYTPYGLDAYDVAAISTFSAAALGVGATVLGLGAVAWRPEALEELIALSPALTRWAALALIAAICLPLLWASLTGAGFRLLRFRVAAPEPKILLAQMSYTAVDVAGAAMTLYLLLPEGGPDFPAFLAIFSAAMIAGALSHVPGGVGVFETVMIAAMPAGAPLGEVAAALLLYRILYFLLPFALAVAALSLNEARMAFGLGVSALGARARPTFKIMEPGLRALGGLTPSAMAAMVFFSGLAMLFCTLIPADDGETLDYVLPLAFVEGGALLSSALGAGLIVIALGLARGAEGAWLLAMLSLLGGAGAALAHELDWPRAALLLISALLLAPARREFIRPTRLTRGLFTPGWIALVAAAVAASLFTLFIAQKSTPYANQLWWQFALDERAPRALRAALTAGLTLSLLLLIAALRSPRSRSARADLAALDHAARIVAAQPLPEAALALTGDKALLFDDSEAAFVMFASQGRNWVALGGAVGPDAAAESAADAFIDAARAAGARPLVYQVGPRALPLWLDRGFALHKLGEEAVVDLAAFSLEGPARKKLRTAYNRAQRDGLSFELAKPPHAPELIEALRAISDDWLRSRRTREKQFSLGRFDTAYLQRFPLALLRHDGRLVAFANILRAGDAASIDLMRQAADAPGGAMEHLFTALMLRLKQDGLARFSLGMAPLAGLERARRRMWSRLGALLYRHGGALYNFAGLRGFKQKFDPDWRPRYLAAPPGVNPLLAVGAVATLIAGGARGIVSR